jgi:translation initiation factor 1 (eIF-1/SUI1)
MKIHKSLYIIIKYYAFFFISIVAKLLYNPREAYDIHFLVTPNALPQERVSHLITEKMTEAGYKCKISTSKTKFHNFVYTILGEISFCTNINGMKKNLKTSYAKGLNIRKTKLIVQFNESNSLAK